MDEQGQNKPSAENVPQPAPEQPPVPKAEPSQWQYQSGNLAPVTGFAEPPAPNQPNADNPTARDSISWSASEFMHHEKASSWYIYVVIAALVLATAIYFLTKDIFSVAVIVVIGIIFGVFGALKPKVLNYAVSPDGIQVGNRHFSFEEFRSFAVIQEGALPSIQLLPHKRFALAITMYLDPQQADKIVEILGEYLPFEHQDRDFMDKFASKIHF
jgi:hypothetical protein